MSEDIKKEETENTVKVEETFTPEDIIEGQEGLPLSIEEDCQGFEEVE